MDFWINKFESVIITLLSKEVRYSNNQLDYRNSKLNIKEHQSKVFDILTELHYCDCCNKHQIDKPCIPKKWISNKIPVSDTYDCICDCRHTARMICRMCD